MNRERFRAWFRILLLAGLLAACDPAPPPAPTREIDVQGTVDAQVEATLAAQLLPAATQTPAAPSTAAPAEASTASPTADATATRPAEEATGSENDPLAADWYLDRDGNAIPDFVEEAGGYDPLVDDCARDECAGAGAEGLSLLLREHNTLFVVDSSGSMGGQTTGRTKMEVAKAAIEYYTRLTPQMINLGLLVYGHKGANTDAGKAESCAGIELLAPLGELRATTITDTLQLFQPTGWTPIAASLDAAQQAFAGTAPDAVNRIIRVSDGIETCDGNPVAAAQRIFDDTEIEVVIDVVGFDIQSREEQEQLLRLAEAGGGEYFNAQSGIDLQDYFEALVQTRLEISEAMTCLFSTASAIRTCEQAQYTHAERWIQDARGAARAGGQDEQVASLTQILKQIDSSLEARIQSWEALLTRRDELRAELDRLRELHRTLSGR